MIRLNSCAANKSGWCEKCGLLTNRGQCDQFNRDLSHFDENGDWNYDDNIDDHCGMDILSEFNLENI